MLVLVLGMWLGSSERGGLNWFRICCQYLSCMSASARFWPRPLSIGLTLTNTSFGLVCSVLIVSHGISILNLTMSKYS